MACLLALRTRAALGLFSSLAAESASSAKIDIFDATVIHQCTIISHLTSSPPPHHRLRQTLSRNLPKSLHRRFKVFQRVPCDSPAAQDDARFEYFVGTVLPQLLRTKQGHTAVFIPSYFDYVRLRNHLIKNKVSAGNVHEYSRGSEVRKQGEL